MRYISDLVRTIKQERPNYQKIERGIWIAHADRFRLDTEIPPEIKLIDRQALATEKRDLVLDPNPWTDMAEPLPRRASAGYAPDRTAAEFLAVARRLGIK